jgi:hypothetical protein
MPNYQLLCKKFKHQFEAFQSWGDYDAKLPLLCPLHQKPGKRLIATREVLKVTRKGSKIKVERGIESANISGTSSFRLGHTAAINKELEGQLGMHCNSAAEVDARCKEKKLAMIDKEWNPSPNILKDKNEACLKRMEEGLHKELSKHSEVIMPDGSTQSLGI